MEPIIETKKCKMTIKLSYLLSALLLLACLFSAYPNALCWFYIINEAYIIYQPIALVNLPYYLAILAILVDIIIAVINLFIKSGKTNKCVARYGTLATAFILLISIVLMAFYHHSSPLALVLSSPALMAYVLLIYLCVLSYMGADSATDNVRVVKIFNLLFSLAAISSLLLPYVVYNNAGVGGAAVVFVPFSDTDFTKIIADMNSYVGYAAAYFSLANLLVIIINTAISAFALTRDRYFRTFNIVRALVMGILALVTLILMAVAFSYPFYYAYGLLLLIGVSLLQLLASVMSKKVVLTGDDELLIAKDLDTETLGGATIATADAPVTEENASVSSLQEEPILEKENSADVATDETTNEEVPNNNDEPAFVAEDKGEVVSPIISESKPIENEKETPLVFDDGDDEIIEDLPFAPYREDANLMYTAPKYAAPPIPPTKSAERSFLAAPVLERKPRAPQPQQEIKGYDAFYDSLSSNEKAEFNKLFVFCQMGENKRLPRYVIGGDNELFFDRVMIFIGKFRDMISVSLLEKIYNYVSDR